MTSTPNVAGEHADVTPPAGVDATLESPVDVRARLVEALKLDLVGPWPGHSFEVEQLPGRTYPSNWYLTGFLVPSGTQPEQKADVDEDEELAEVPETMGLPEESNEEPTAAKKGYFPSSIGLSFLVPRAARSIEAVVSWGDYFRRDVNEKDGSKTRIWQRRPREERVVLSLGAPEPPPIEVPGSNGMQLHVVERQIVAEDLVELIPEGTRSISVFLVNARAPNDAEPDLATAFQASLKLRCEEHFVPRPDLRGKRARDWDEKVADLHYAESPEYAVGHGVSAEWIVKSRKCHELCTTWIPNAEVEQTATVEVKGVDLRMEVLGQLPDGVAAEHALQPLVREYRHWIQQREFEVAALPGARREVALELLRLAGVAASRIEEGIKRLAIDADALDAFRVANRAVARALRKRLQASEEPAWRAFQLAFILLNLPGLVDPNEKHRDTVDLLFFPTGGGKTEAYLGLAAFSMVLRRIKHPNDNGLGGAGVSVIMRYTLRLLTLD